MIRRGFWLTVGAVAGIAGYRRACAAGRRVSAGLGLHEAVRFARDVRDGMELYRLAHSAPARSTLATERTERGSRTDHDTRPEDGR